MADEKVELLIDSVGESLRPVVNEEILKKMKGLNISVPSTKDALKDQKPAQEK